MIKIYVDGASRGNPGKSGAGIYIIANERHLEYSIPLANMSNHEAEFQAVIKALEICMRKFPNEILSFRSDSKVVVQAIEKEFVRNDLFKPLLAIIINIGSTFPHFFIKWIPSKSNYHADRLAKAAIHQIPGEK